VINPAALALDLCAVATKHGAETRLLLDDRHHFTGMEVITAPGGICWMIRLVPFGTFGQEWTTTETMPGEHPTVLARYSDYVAQAGRIAVALDDWLGSQAVHADETRAFLSPVVPQPGEIRVRNDSASHDRYERKLS